MGRSQQQSANKIYIIALAGTQGLAIIPGRRRESFIYRPGSLSIWIVFSRLDVPFRQG